MEKLLLKLIIEKSRLEIVIKTLLSENFYKPNDSFSSKKSDEKYYYIADMRKTIL